MSSPDPPPDSTEPWMIEFDSVSKRFADGTLAVSDFSLRIPHGQILVLLGSSGSGKTTLLRMVNKMTEPTAGTVQVDGRDVDETDAVKLRRSIGYVMQAAGLLPHRTVLQNVATVPLLNGTDRRTALDAAADLLETVGLDPSVGQRYPDQLSGGQQQRVGVARALADNPNVLLMDEPFGAVDPIVRRELQDELLRLQADLGKTIMFVTHDVDEAFRLGDRVVVLADSAQIAQVGTPEEIIADPADDFVASFIGAELADRRLSVSTEHGREIVLDSLGRPVGVLA